MKHEAIYGLYPTVKSIDDDTAYDADGNVVSWDATTVATKETELLTAKKLDDLRVERDAKLADTDHYGLSDQTMTDAMITYRQALRDITDTYQSLDTVVWPTKP